MKKILFTLVLILAATAVRAQENRPTVRLGGTFFLSTYFDTYKSVESRDGALYSYPLPPDPDREGNDRNAVGQFGMSVYATRLNVRVQDFSLLNADAGAYVETDFLGSGDPGLQMIRLRHAYLDLRWKRDEVLFGQTSSLLMPEEVIAGVLTIGAASPIAPLSRPMMMRYGRTFGERWKFYAAAIYQRPTTGPVEAARNNGFPGVEARLQHGGERLFWGVGGAFQSLMPRLKTDSGLKTDERILSTQATAFLRYRSPKGAQLKLQGVYGGNLARLMMPGGYGKTAYPEGWEKERYSYTDFTGYSIWVDYETRAYGNLRYGLFAGYFENLGTAGAVDPKVLYARDAELQLTGRVSPRVTFQRDNLLIGLEYSFFFSRWGTLFNSHYRPIRSQDLTMNHRPTVLVRYIF